MRRSKILVTAGPTIEPLDPVRFISNFSTGLVGYEIARSCKRRGFDVRLISGPVNLPSPAGVDVVRVETAREMESAILKRIKDSSGIIMTAAVCDFRPAHEAKEKIKKRDKLTLKLIKNPDILERIGARRDLVKIGFSLESERAIANSKKKLKAKKLDLVVINVKNRTNDPFGPGKKDYTILYKNGRIEKIKGAAKRKIAEILAGEMEKMLKDKA